MTEEGTVISLAGNNALVLTKRSQMCDSCGQHASCFTRGKSEDVEIEAVNPARAGIGDRVTITIESSSIFKIALLVYLLPVAGLIAGIAAGNYAAGQYGLDRDLSAIISGAALFTICFLVIRFLSARFRKKKKYMPEITGIISRAGETTSVKNEPQC